METDCILSAERRVVIMKKFVTIFSVSILTFGLCVSSFWFVYKFIEWLFELTNSLVMTIGIFGLIISLVASIWIYIQIKSEGE